MQPCSPPPDSSPQPTPSSPRSPTSSERGADKPPSSPRSSKPQVYPSWDLTGVLRYYW